ncbi:DUF3945 domain-containing protein [Elizabethkingia anophelis]|uniref:DUF3945 domain-containing protein n=1 Tax=Elizabethkingia anophelis TaxID=1117645 RepID=UPI001368A946|nr:DUF3945 domain-containing protein [Elizabethkingia anophelis]MYY43957.1 DUF3945 domain-containing protein [Elizabethkingia anophelis]
METPEINPNSATLTPDQLFDILLILDKEKKKLQAVKGIDSEGRPQSVEINKNNENQFIKIDRQGNVVSNFLKNFFSQLKNPTQFIYLKVPEELLGSLIEKFSQYLKSPNSELQKIIDQYQVSPEGKKQKQNQQIENKMENAQKTSEAPQYRFSREQINWETMNKMGLSRERLEKQNLLEPLLKGYKTDVISTSFNDNSVFQRFHGRLSLSSGEDGNAILMMHGVRLEPPFNYPFLGHTFTDEDKKNLLQTGNMGRVVPLVNPKTQETIPSLISLDKQTNDIIALRLDRVKIPDEICGVKLDNTQKEVLQSGKSLYIEGMVSKNGKTFSTHVQFNADKQHIEFQFPENKNQQKVYDIAETKVFRGKEISDADIEKLKAGEVVKITGLMNKTQKPYEGYLTYDVKTKTSNFTFDHPHEVKNNIKNDESTKPKISIQKKEKPESNEVTTQQQKVNKPVVQKKPKGQKL